MRYTTEYWKVVEVVEGVHSPNACQSLMPGSALCSLCFALGILCVHMCSLLIWKRKFGQIVSFFFLKRISPLNEALQQKVEAVLHIFRPENLFLTFCFPCLNQSRCNEAIHMQNCSKLRLCHWPIVFCAKSKGGKNREQSTTGGLADICLPDKSLSQASNSDEMYTIMRLCFD